MFKRRETCEDCEEFYRLFSQVMTGVDELEMKCKSITALAQRNEWYFFNIRDQIKHANKENIDIIPESLQASLDNLKRLLRELEYADDCLTSALEHIDCFVYTE